LISALFGAIGGGCENLNRPWSTCREVGCLVTELCRLVVSHRFQGGRCCVYQGNWREPLEKKRIGESLGGFEKSRVRELFIQMYEGE